MLTDEERKQLRDALRNTPLPATMPADYHYLKQRVLPVMEVAVESIMAARVRAARAQELRDTAVTLDSDSHAQVSYRCVAQSLRDRANHIESSNNGLG